MDRERMHAGRELPRERLVDHAMAVDPALPPEGLRHDIEPVMGLPARAVSRMPFVLVRFIYHAQACGRKGDGQLLGDDIGDRLRHGLGMASTGSRGQWLD